MLAKARVELPADLIAAILDYLPVPDLLCAAQVCLLFKDLVYDDRRWIAKLKSIGCWSDEAARQHHEDELFRRQQKINGKKPIKTKEAPEVAALAEARVDDKAKPIGNLDADLLNFTPKREKFTSNGADEGILNALASVRSIRGRARVEFAKLWIALYPLYEDVATAAKPGDPILFRRFRLPEEQAQMLKQLQQFGQARAVDDWANKNSKVMAMMELFKGAAIREFEIAYDNRDEESMKRYSGVLGLLEDEKACVYAFSHKNILFANSPANPFECFDSFSDDSSINLAPMSHMTAGLALELVSQRDLIDRVFHQATQAWQVFVERVFSLLLTDYVNKLIDYAQQQSTQAYLLALTGSYQHLFKLILELSPEASDRRTSEVEIVNGVMKKAEKVKQPDHYLLQLLQRIYEEHVSYYLEEEIAVLRDHVVREVTNWDKQIKNESLQTEQLFLSGINREVAKKNFLTSFTKVILMPVNVVGSVMPFPARPLATTDESQTPGIIAGNNDLPGDSRADMPTTELAARAAIMKSGLARIKRLLSLEVALQLIHTCKESIDRARSFVSFPGRMGEETREQCETMFSIMLQALGSRHIQVGFDMALNSLKSFNPRNNKEVAQVQPLVDFLELVHVGDLMQQMVDVFYNQELSGIVDKSDFLSPAVKEKKKFEQMIDEKVAEGLNRGIDVLMEQIDYILITTQKPTDFKPWLVLGQDDHLDLRESATARAVVECLTTHTELLRGSTDKGTLDVFFQEVGVRFFGSLCKHFKRQSFTIEGGLKLISDLNYYHAFVTSLKQPSVTPYFVALKELGNIYIISGRDGKAVGQVISDIARFGGVLRPEDVYEFAERRADWAKVKKHVDRVIYGTKITEDCIIS
ncbi:putative Secretion pathway protein Sls2/Rcy1 [Taphrina deformans PYCC 5710]|uniref:Secretion pathway protein Sls2/Rcy1 n=1 Tax=Taphrina deformans (strain PYCC 5710 / ATCC 11124 / CBS 356.35 / IMI 108563 / JCM 9778 / NBRC 8474) TaxID=1097556 RepID=R4XHE4_TAPDE|nr:putative Secretion pathway protein Sls2/Rcy1 [Taphrina deformans PYCC 5710]|eukprot:CCG85182.1 putative Secretion pathway protein Sls2/Rcy1 [Taphrina deformans PYCC 5710]